MNAIWQVLAFALLFWFIGVVVIGAFVFLVGWPQSDEPASAAWSLLLLIPPLVGGIYGWRRSRSG
jgi:hypothetical protein